MKISSNLKETIIIISESQIRKRKRIEASIKKNKKIIIKKIIIKKLNTKKEKLNIKKENMNKKKMKDKEKEKRRIEKKFLFIYIY